MRPKWVTPEWNQETDALTQNQLNYTFNVYKGKSKQERAKEFLSFWHKAIRAGYNTPNHGKIYEF